ncbi:MAG: flavin reductase family protein [Rickettsiaceae bacterium]
MQIDDFKKAVGKFPTGVCVISTAFNDQLWGFTANTFVSVSLAPPLVSFCLDKNSGSFDAFTNAPNFSVSILASDQAPISQYFARRILNKFKKINYRLGETGVPFVLGAVSFLECKKFKEIECGDHYIFVGEVLKIQIDEAKSPLLYFAKSYREIK